MIILEDLIFTIAAALTTAVPMILIIPLIVAISYFKADDSPMENRTHSR